MTENLVTKFNIKDSFSEKKKLILTKSIVVFLGLFSIVIGVYADSLYQLMIFSFSLLFGMLFAPMVFAIYWEKANEYGAIVSCLSGALFIITGSILQGSLIPGPEWFYTLIPPIISTITMIVVSLLTQNHCPPKPLKNKKGDNLKWGYLN
jgi:Na+/proline symporter